MSSNRLICWLCSGGLARAVVVTPCKCIWIPAIDCSSKWRSTTVSVSIAIGVSELLHEIVSTRCLVCPTMKTIMSNPRKLRICLTGGSAEEILGFLRSILPSETNYTFSFGTDWYWLVRKMVYWDWEPVSFEVFDSHFHWFVYRASQV